MTYKDCYYSRLKDQCYDALKRPCSPDTTSEYLAILDLIKEHEERKWIPVSEKLPKEDGYYIFTENSGRVCTYEFHKGGNSEEYWKRCAVAWMPLPESYKAESVE